MPGRSPPPMSMENTSSSRAGSRKHRSTSSAPAPPGATSFPRLPRRCASPLRSRGSQRSTATSGAPGRGASAPSERSTMHAPSSVPVTSRRIWQNEANCEEPSRLRASPPHRGPRAARSRNVARARTPPPPIWPNEANAKPFALKPPPGILAERSQWRQSPWLPQLRSPVVIVRASGRSSIRRTR